jgi:hypothetical protein
MLNIKKIPNEILNNLSRRGHSDQDIAQMSWGQAFDEYCNWHGLIQWGPPLRNTYEILSASSDNDGIVAELLPSDIQESLKKRGHTEHDIYQMSADEAFDEHCEWNSLIDWGPKLREIMVVLKNAESK